MGIADKLIDAAVSLGRFLLGDKPEPKLEEPLGELEVEKERQRMADRRRERAAKKNGGQ
jgi:hypothetical protein